MLDNRIAFKDAQSRTAFFLAVRKVINADAWEEVRNYFKVKARSVFQKYQYGQCLLPEKLFNEMLLVLTKEEQEVFKASIECKPKNWGAVLGGKTTYHKYLAVFARGRKKGLKRMLEIGGNPHKVDLNIGITPDICELVGAIIGDGCITQYGRQRRIQISGDSRYEPYYFEKLARVCKQTFVCNPRICKRKGNVLRLTIYSKRLFLFLTKVVNLPIGEKTKTITIPEILLASNEFKKSVLRGIFDTDGFVYLDRRTIYLIPYPRLGITTTSTELFNQIVQILKEFGFTNFYIRKEKRSDANHIELYGFEQIKKWIEVIGSSNKKHLDKLASIAQPGSRARAW